MNYEQAKRILGISDQDDSAAVKRKYRRMIGSCHPDTAGADSPEHVRRTQEINEAYELLKKSGCAGTSKEEGMQGASRKEQDIPWKAGINEKAFCDRNIYLYYSMEVSDEQLYYRAARGKYMWDPDEEDFALFLTSIRHASRELLETAAESGKDFRKQIHTQEIHAQEVFFRFQARLFQSLALQYVHPVKTLRSIAKPQTTDERGREIYHLKAFLGTKGNSRMFQAMRQLKEGETVYPHSFEGNRILTVNKQGESLGHLSLEDDRLYFSVVPLLKKQLARVKLTVRNIQAGRVRDAKVTVSFYFRLEQGADDFAGEEESLRIADILREYEEYVRRAERG